MKLWNWLFGATEQIVRNKSIPIVAMEFDRVGLRSFDNETARIFGVDNSSSSHVDNHKNNFSLVDEGPTFGINRNFGLVEIEFSINFSKAKTKLYFSLHCNTDNNYLFFIGKEVFKFTDDNKIVNFPIQFCLWSISNRFSATDSREVSLNGSLSEFLADYNSIDKSGILDTHKYSMIENNMK